MALFIYISVQNRIVLLIILVNLRIIDHGGRDQKLHLIRHAVVNDHRNASFDDFKIIGSGFRNNVCKRKFAEALLSKELRPILNFQEKSVELELFN